MIERLLVIAIIAILAAMLLPVLSAAKQTALRVSSINGLKQCGIAMQIYSGDYGERQPYAFVMCGRMDKPCKSCSSRNLSGVDSTRGYYTGEDTRRQNPMRIFERRHNDRTAIIVKADGAKASLKFSPANSAEPQSPFYVMVKFWHC